MNFNDSLGVYWSNGIGSELFWHQNVYGLSGTLPRSWVATSLSLEASYVTCNGFPIQKTECSTLNFDQAATANSSGAGGNAVASALLGIVGAQGTQVRRV
jgi:hypothetical protein